MRKGAARQQCAPSQCSFQTFSTCSLSLPPHGPKQRLFSAEPLRIACIQLLVTALLGAAVRPWYGDTTQASAMCVKCYYPGTVRIMQIEIKRKPRCANEVESATRDRDEKTASLFCSTADRRLSWPSNRTKKGYPVSASTYGDYSS